jgi:hypothetical protein
MMSFDLETLATMVLWAAIVAIALLLRWALRRTVELAALVDDLRRPRTPRSLVAGMPAPEFAAPVLERGRAIGRTLDSAALRGRHAILMFISPAHAEAAPYVYLGASIHGLWHKANGNLYVVCSGREDACRELATVAVPTHADDDGPGSGAGHKAHPMPIPVLLDADHAVAERFLVTRTPMAVGIDADGHVEYTGLQRTPEEVEEIFRESFGSDGPHHTTAG